MKESLYMKENILELNATSLWSCKPPEVANADFPLISNPNVYTNILMEM